MAASPWLVVCDFDGTITVEDTLAALVRRRNRAGFDRGEVGLREGWATLAEVLRWELEPICGDHDQIVAEAVERAAVRPGFAEFVAAAERGGHRVCVVSSGLRSVIAPVLRREGLEHLEVIAHDARFSPAGTRVDLRPGDACAECGEACKRDAVVALDGGRPVAYVGDGYSDRCAALAADRRFARRSLARWLDARGVGYTPFDTFHDVRRALFEEAPC